MNFGLNHLIYSSLFALFSAQSIPAAGIPDCLSAQEPRLQGGTVSFRVDNRCAPTVSAIGLAVDFQSPATRPRVWGHDFSPGLAVAGVVANFTANPAASAPAGIPPAGYRVFSFSVGDQTDVPGKARITLVVFTDCTVFGDPKEIRELLEERAASIAEVRHWKAVLDAIPEANSTKARSSALLDRMRSDDIRGRIPDSGRRQVADATKRDLQGMLSQALGPGQEATPSASPFDVVLAMIAARADRSQLCPIGK